MRHLVHYAAAALDGFIADEDGSFDGMPMRRLLLLTSTLLALAGCRRADPDAAVAETPSADTTATYTELYRPQYHFTPAVHWMNDPNGLVYHDGEYHLFYQYNPFGIRWGHMSWGHAVSTDLVRWRHLPVALPETDGVMIFSGSAVADTANTSGFGRDGATPLVAVYTGHDPERSIQDQRLAYSTDRGRTWTQYAGNPVLDLSMSDFRDPKVFWYQPDRRWIMVVVLPHEHKVQFYGSPDLKTWTHLSDFGPAGATGGVWECPDLFELPVDGDPANTKWVLDVDLNPGSVAGGSGGQYFVGTFDGTTFVDEDTGASAWDGPGTAQWVDYGKDFYAAVTWSGVPEEDGRRLWIGWANNWQYAQDIPTAPWRSAQSIPRALELRTIGDGLRLVQIPVAELRTLRGPGRTLRDMVVAEGDTPLADAGISGRSLELVAEFEIGSARTFGLRVHRGAGQETVVGYDVERAEVFVDRTRSGAVDFHPDFAGRYAGPLPAGSGRVRLHLFLDWSMVEVFAGDGATVLTNRVFPDPASDGLEVFAEGGRVTLRSLEAWPLAPAHPSR